MPERGLADIKAVTTQHLDLKSGKPSRPLEWIDTPVLGLATLLEIFEGDHEGVDELVDAALVSIDADAVRIAGSADGSDRPTLIEAAHRLKGTSGSIRSTRVLEMSSAIEKAAKAGASRADPALLLGLRSAILELHAEVQTGRPHQRTPTAPLTA
jgi:hypothetical protein